MALYFFFKTYKKEMLEKEARKQEREIKKAAETGARPSAQKPMHQNSLQAGSTALIVVDIQEAFRDAIPGSSSLIERAVIAVQGFQILGLPVIVTEQYPKGLGRTVEEILLSLSDISGILEKSTFQCDRM